MNNIFTKKRLCFFIKTFFTILFTAFTTLGLDHLFEAYITDNKIKFLFILVVCSVIVAGIYTYVRISIINKKIEIKSENLELNIIRGDIFKQNKGLIIIPVDNEFKNHDYTNINTFPETSVQSQFMRNIYKNTEKTTLINGNSLYTYDNQKFVLFNMGKLDDNNRLYLKSIGAYFELVNSLCNLINEIERNQEFFIPVVGSRIRFKNETKALSGEKRLNFLIIALKMYKFEQKVNITIVVFSDTREDYKFDEL